MLLLQWYTLMKKTCLDSAYSVHRTMLGATIHLYHYGLTSIYNFFSQEKGMRWQKQCGKTQLCNPRKYQRQPLEYRLQKQVTRWASIVQKKEYSAPNLHHVSWYFGGLRKDVGGGSLGTVVQENG